MQRPRTLSFSGRECALYKCPLSFSPSLSVFVGLNTPLVPGVCAAGVVLCLSLRISSPHHKRTGHWRIRMRPPPIIAGQPAQAQASRTTAIQAIYKTGQRTADRTNNQPSQHISMHTTRVCIIIPAGLSGCSIELRKHTRASRAPTTPQQSWLLTTIYIIK